MDKEYMMRMSCLLHTKDIVGQSKAESYPHAFVFEIECNINLHLEVLYLRNIFDVTTGRQAH